MVSSSADLVEDALRLIGALGVSDTAPDEDQFRVALRRFDQLVSYNVGKQHFWFFRPEVQVVELNANDSDYSINSLLSEQLQLVQSVFWREGDIEYKLELIRQQEYDELRKSNALKNMTRPRYCFIERDDSPVMHILPAPSVDNTSAVLRGQAYSDDLTKSGGNVPSGFPKAWELPLTHDLAAQLGTGLITRIPSAELRDHRGLAQDMYEELEVYNNRENVNRPRFTKVRDF